MSSPTIKRKTTLTKRVDPLEKEVTASMDKAIENRKRALAVNKMRAVEGLFEDKTEELRVKFKQPIEEDAEENSSEEVGEKKEKKEE